MPATSGTLISSVQRALRLVDLVATAARPTPVKAIAQAAGLNLGTAYNLTRTLVHEGYLAVEPDGLVLGSQFPSLCRSPGEKGVFLARVRQTLRAVSAEHGATAYLARFSAGEVQLVDVVDAAGSPRFTPWAGLADTAPGTALGHQILAQLSREQRVDFLARHPPRRRTAYPGTRRAPILNRPPRPPGHGDEPAESTFAGTCVAAPVRAPDVIAALAVSTDALRRGFDLAALTRHVLDSAALLSFQLGAERRARWGA